MIIDYYLALCWGQLWNPRLIYILETVEGLYRAGVCLLVRTRGITCEASKMELSPDWNRICSERYSVVSRACEDHICTQQLIRLRLYHMRLFTTTPSHIGSDITKIPDITNSKSRGQRSEHARKLSGNRKHMHCGLMSQHRISSRKPIEREVCGTG